MKAPRFEYIVVGAGMMGAAAARHLSEESGDVALIGPPEPQKRENHGGVFGGHYDESRIVRTLDTDERWGLFATRSIARFRDLEQRSGISFYREVGHLAVSPTGDDPGNYCRQIDRVASTVPADYARLDESDLRERFLYLRIPEVHQGRYQSTVGGFINPRALVRAQIKVATDQGTRYLPQEVTAINPAPRGCTVKIDDGTELEGEKVLVAAGAFANQAGLLPEALDLSLMGRTVLHLELGEQDLHTLKGMPSIIYRPVNERRRSYILPPTRYPNGKHYLKIGSSLNVENPLASVEEVKAWFRTNGNPEVAELLEEIVREIFPDINPLSTHTETCVNSYANQTLPYICKLPNNNLYVLTGMNGGTAKSSDEYGYIAAQMLRLADWKYDVPSSEFGVITR